MNFKYTRDARDLAQNVLRNAYNVKMFRQPAAIFRPRSVNTDPLCPTANMRDSVNGFELTHP